MKRMKVKIEVISNKMSEILFSGTPVYTPYERAVCIEGCVLLTLDFFIYLACFIAVLLTSGRLKFGRYTILMLLVPLLDYLLAAV